MFYEDVFYESATKLPVLFGFNFHLHVRHGEKRGGISKRCTTYDDKNGKKILAIEINMEARKHTDLDITFNHYKKKPRRGSTSK